jgi:general secretion pathway protein M
MNELLASLKQQWAALPGNVRRLALVLAVLMTVLLLYVAMWRPLQRDLAQLRGSVPQEGMQLDWMRAQAPVAKSLRAKASTVGVGLVPSIEQSALAQGIRAAITRIDPEGNNGARVTLEAVSFNSFVAWLAELQASQGAAVEELKIDAHPTSGMVNVQLRLRTGT